MAATVAALAAVTKLRRVMSISESLSIAVLVHQFVGCLACTAIVSTGRTSPGAKAIVHCASSR